MAEMSTTVVAASESSEFLADDSFAAFIEVEEENSDTLTTYNSIFINKN